MSPRNSPRVRYRPGPFGAPVTGPAAVTPNAMSASLASAITKSSGVYRPAAMLLSLRSRRRTGRWDLVAPAGVGTDSFNLPIGLLKQRRSSLSALVHG